MQDVLCFSTDVTCLYLDKKSVYSHVYLQIHSRHALEIKKAEEDAATAIRIAELKKQKEERQRAQQELLQATKTKVEQDIASIRRRRGMTGCIRRDLDKNHPKDKHEYNKVVDRVEKYVQHEHGVNMAVTRVEEIVNEKLTLAWLESYLGLFGQDTEPELLFHGTSEEGVKGITENGFRLPVRSPNNMFGAGVYFATDSSKSAQTMYTKGSCMLLLCAVRRLRSSFKDHTTTANIA